MNVSLKIHEENINGDFYLRASGDLIILNANQMQGIIDNAIASGHIEIHLDLTSIQYIDSFGIGVIVKTKSELDRLKGRLFVIVNPTILALFEKCHLDDYIELELLEENKNTIKKAP